MMPDAALAATERQFLRLIGESNPIAQFFVHPFTLGALPRDDSARAHIARYYDSFEQIKKQGLDAYWTEAAGGDKRWYQVRVSHFKDKDSARAYGESLKARGVIDDYYVANYQRP